MSEPDPVRLQQLLRETAEAVLHLPPEWLDELDSATFAADHMQQIARDPVLRESAKRANRSNVEHWALANIRDPGAPVPPNTSAAVSELTRDLVRRGLAEGSGHTYRAAQNAVWLRWMEMVFARVATLDEARVLLEVSARSIGDFVDTMIETGALQVQREREELTSGSHAERREVVALLLAGAPIPRERAEARLGYRLRQAHTAAVIWTDAPAPDSASLDAAAEALMRALGARHRLTVIAGAGTRWLWMAEAGPLDADVVASLLTELPGVRIALGTQRRDVDGFRRSHLEAVATQQMLARLESPRRAASFEEVQVVALATTDPDRADEFVRAVLQGLLQAGEDVRTTLRIYLHHQGNASATATTLHTHRNTVLRRVERAEALLPRPLSENAVAVAVALDILHWRGSRA